MMKTLHFSTIDSTNTYAKKLISDSMQNGTFSEIEPILITAETQTAGRGRLGRNFYSPAYTGIYMSLIIKADLLCSMGTAFDGNFEKHEKNTKNINPAIYTSTAAVAVSRILDKTFNVETKIKWVNDIYLNKKKICGILTEGVLGIESGKIEALVVGIGINISTKDFPDDLNIKAGSLIDFSKNEHFFVNSGDNLRLAQDISEECLKIFTNAHSLAQALKEYKQRSCVLGQKITVHPVIDQTQHNYEATATDITDDAKLVVYTLEGTKKILDSGEISIIL